MGVMGVDPLAAFQNPNQQADTQAQMIQHPTALQQAFDPRGIQASMARGNNVYMGGLPYAPGAGRPRNPQINFGDMTNPAMQDALQRRMANYGKETRAREARGGRTAQQ